MGRRTVELRGEACHAQHFPSAVGVDTNGDDDRGGIRTNILSGREESQIQTGHRVTYPVQYPVFISQYREISTVGQPRPSFLHWVTAK